MATVKYKDPADGQWKTVVGGGAGQAFAQVSATEPTPRGVGDIWINTSADAISWDTSWKTPALTGGWATHITFEGPRFRREIGGIVRLQGYMRNNNIGTSTTAFTLPVGYRPESTLVFPVTYTDTGYAEIFTTITTDGKVDPPRELAEYFLDGLTFGIF